MMLSAMGYYIYERVEAFSNSGHRFFESDDGLVLNWHLTDRNSSLSDLNARTAICRAAFGPVYPRFVPASRQCHGFGSASPLVYRRLKPKQRM